MDVASHRPAVGSGPVGRPDGIQYREAVRTELPRSQRVSQPDRQGASAAADDRRAGDQAARDERALADRRARMERLADTIRENLQRRVDRDDKAGTLVYRTVDADTGDVVAQYPDELVLKLRTYAREMARRDAGDGESHRVEKIA